MVLMEGRIEWGNEMAVKKRREEKRREEKKVAWLLSLCLTHSLSLSFQCLMVELKGDVKYHIA